MHIEHHHGAPGDRSFLHRWPRQPEDVTCRVRGVHETMSSVMDIGLYPVLSYGATGRDLNSGGAASIGRKLERTSRGQVKQGA